MTWRGERIIDARTNGTTFNDIALRLLGHTPEQELLNCQAKVESISNDTERWLIKKNELRDDQVYEKFVWTESGDPSYKLWTIVKKTAAQIHACETWRTHVDHESKIVLPRLPLEAGEEVRHGKRNGKYFVMGFVVRRHYEQLITSTESAFVDACERLEAVSFMIRHNEVPLTWRDYEIAVSIARSLGIEPPEPPDDQLDELIRRLNRIDLARVKERGVVCWQKEGF